MKYFMQTCYTYIKKLKENSIMNTVIDGKNKKNTVFLPEIYSVVRRRVVGIQHWQLIQHISKG